MKCPWCGVLFTPSKYHPGNCGECGGPVDAPSPFLVVTPFNGYYDADLDAVCSTQTIPRDLFHMERLNG